MIRLVSMAFSRAFSVSGAGRATDPVPAALGATANVGAEGPGCVGYPRRTRDATTETGAGTERTGAYVAASRSSGDADGWPGIGDPAPTDATSSAKTSPDRTAHSPKMTRVRRNHPIRLNGRRHDSGGPRVLLPTPVLPPPGQTSRATVAPRLDLGRRAPLRSRQAHPAGNGCHGCGQRPT